MNHAGEGLLQAYIDGEVDSAAAAELTAHLDACTECGHELEDLRDASATFAGAMRLLGGDVRLDAARTRILAAHRANAATTASAANSANTATVTPISSHRSLGRFATGSLARAAALVLLVAGGAAAMIPGSPLRRWIGDRIANVRASRVAAPVVNTKLPAPLPKPRREMVPGAEMSIAPVDGKVTVDISAQPGDGQIVVRFVNSDRATVQTDSSAHDVAFRSAPGAIEILDLGASDAAIQLPRTLRNAEIRVNGKRFYMKDGEAVRVLGPVIRRSDTEIVFQSGS